MKKPKVDHSKCEGFAVCVSFAPGVFELNSEFKSIVKDPQGADEDTIQDAVNACPTQAISWVEE